MCGNLRGKLYDIFLDVRDCRVQKCNKAGVLCSSGAGLATMHNVLSTRKGGAGYLCMEDDNSLELFDCKSYRNSVHYECDDKALLSRVRCDPDVPCDSLRSCARKSIRAQSKKLREYIRHP